MLGLLLQRLPNTLALSLSAMAVALAIGVPLGFLAAARRGGWIDAGLMGLAMVGISIPSFWLGLMLLFFFAVHLQWLPVTGNGPLNLVLPAVTSQQFVEPLRRLRVIATARLGQRQLAF